MMVFTWDKQYMCSHFRESLQTHNQVNPIPCFRNLWHWMNKPPAFSRFNIIYFFFFWRRNHYFQSIGLQAVKVVSESGKRFYTKIVTQGINWPYNSKHIQPKSQTNNSLPCHHSLLQHKTRIETIHSTHSLPTY